MRQFSKMMDNAEHVKHTYQVDSKINGVFGGVNMHSRVRRFIDYFKDNNWDKDDKDNKGDKGENSNDDDDENENPEFSKKAKNILFITNFLGVIFATTLFYKYWIYIRKELTTKIVFEDLFNLLENNQIYKVEVKRL
jgi:hypothetical protein